MSPITIPFIAKSNTPFLTASCLLFVGAAFALTAYLLFRHYQGQRKAKKAGVDRRHDGRHGNH